MNRSSEDVTLFLQSTLATCSIALILLSVLVSLRVSAATPAFPGAAGFGSDTPGGRYGRVLKVTRLGDDESEGTLRWAIQYKGPRIVVFDVAGTIKLHSQLRITEPFITIAGQSAPNPGITLTNSRLVVATHDVVIRGLRARPGDDPKGAPGSKRDGISIGDYQQWGGVYNVVIDHCSIMWAVDKNLGTWYGAHDVTISWNLIAQALRQSLHPEGASSHGLLIGDGSERISIHHNLFAHNDDRNPTIKPSEQIEVVNNYIFNWGGQALNNYGDGLVTANVINNYFKPGRDSVKRPPIYIRGNARMYLFGNLDETYRLRHSQDQYLIAHNYNHPIPMNSALRLSTPAFLGSGLPIDDVNTVRDLIPKFVGAITHRDEFEDAIATQVTQGLGRIIDSPSQTQVIQKTDVPHLRSTALSSPNKLIDSDQDGMPDTYERSVGLDATVNDSAADPDEDGYTHIEHYINGLISAHPKRRKAP